MFNKHDVDIMITLMDAVESSIRDEHCKLRRVGVEMRQWSSCWQRRQLEGSQISLYRYVNFGDHYGNTPLFISIYLFCDDAAGVLQLTISPRMVQLLVEAGADTTSPIRITDKAGVLQSFGTPLAYTNQRLRGKKVGEKAATEEQLHTLQAVRRVLMRVEAVHAVSWLWHKHAPSIARAAAITRRITKTTPASSTQMTVMLRILRRRRRRVQRGVRFWHLCSGGRLFIHLFCFRIRAKYDVYLVFVWQRLQAGYFVADGIGCLC